MYQAEKEGDQCTNTPTPRNKSRAALRHAGIGPSSVPRAIKKKLVFANALMHEVRQSTSKDKTKKKVAPSILAGAKLWQNTALLDLSKRKLGCQGGRYNSILKVPN